MTSRFHKDLGFGGARGFGLGDTFARIMHSSVVLGFAGILVGCASAPKPDAALIKPQTHSFAIYLVTSTPEQPRHAFSPDDLATVTLAKAPVLSDADFVSYSFADHSIMLKPEAVSRLPQPSVSHAPFVVVADGQRIYLGTFTTLLSSFSSGAPTIVVDHIAAGPQRWSFFGGGTNTISIERAYPGPEFGQGADPRSDERIHTALAGLRKLR